MDEETNQIKHHIDTERKQLGRNLQEIEDRVKSATDLKAQFDKNTGLFLGAAVAGGFLVSLAFRKSGKSANAQRVETRSRDFQAVPSPVKQAASKHLQRVTDTFDDIFAGLIGVASGKLLSLVGEAVPGFQAQYDDLGRQRGQYPDRDFSAVR